MTRGRLAEKTWADYDMGDVNALSKAQLEKAVRRASKAANQRLLRLERAGKNTSGAYKMAMSHLEGRRRFYERTDKRSLAELRKEYASLRSFISAKTSTIQGIKEAGDKRYQTRRRFYERTDKRSLAELRKEYASLRSFISAKTSTIQGIKEAGDKRYQTAVERGYQGTFEEWERDVRKYFAEHVEALFSSDVIYSSITGNKVDVIDDVLATSRAYRKHNKDYTQGRALLDYMRRDEQRKKRQKGR